METLSKRKITLLRFYVAAVTAGALGVLFLAGSGYEWDGSPRAVNAFVVLLAVGLAAELGSVSLNVGSSTFSIAFIPFLAAVFLLGPFPAVVLGGLTVLVVEALFRKKPLMKVVFNTSKEILALALAA